MIINRYDHDALAGETCYQCGEIHKPLVSPAVIFGGVVVIAVVGVLIYFYTIDRKKSAALLREWTRRGNLVDKWVKEGSSLTDDLRDWADMKW